MTAASKACEVCGAPFYRLHLKSADWAARKYCSRKCASIAQAALTQPDPSRRQCSKCGRVLLVIAFAEKRSRHKFTKGYESWCRLCMREKDQQRGGRREKLEGSKVRTPWGWLVRWRGRSQTYRSKTYRTEAEADHALAAIRRRVELERAIFGLPLPSDLPVYYVPEIADALIHHPLAFPELARHDFTFAEPHQSWAMVWLAASQVAVACFARTSLKAAHSLAVTGLYALEGEEALFSVNAATGTVFKAEDYAALMAGPFQPAMWALHILANPSQEWVDDAGLVHPGWRLETGPTGDANYTLTLHPLQAKRKSLKRGGHRDLREHEVRGHLRTLGDGHRVPVKPHKRGNAQKGVITKDYEVAIP